LKPYEQRVKATYALMQSFIEFTSRNSATIKGLREAQLIQQSNAKEFPIAWSLNRNKSSEITYKGYQSGRKPSEVSGLPRLYYDRTKPFEKEIPIYNFYKVTSVIKKPKAYIIPQGWWKVIDLLKLNKVNMQQLRKDTVIRVMETRIVDYKSDARQYEMHHPNTNTSISTNMVNVAFRKGDYYIPLNQVANRFLIETLEPQAEDSYFTWNFFDAILGQKEGFSAYSFEDIAAAYLKNNPDLKARLEQRRNSDTAFANSASAQLTYVFKNSTYFEPVNMRYPVYSVLQ